MSFSPQQQYITTDEFTPRQPILEFGTYSPTLNSAPLELPTVQTQGYYSPDPSYDSGYATSQYYYSPPMDAAIPNYAYTPYPSEFTQVFKKQRGDPEEKRQTHIMNEKRRRALLKDGFMEIEAEMGDAGKKVSKFQTVQRCVEFIRGLKQREQELREEVERLRRENERFRRGRV